MDLLINGKEQTLQFGFGFVNKMDIEFKIEQNGMNLGMGVGVGKSLLEETYSLNILRKIIKAATEKTTDRQIEAAIEEYAVENGDVEGLYTGVLDELGKSGLLKAMIAKFEAKAEKEQAKLRAQAESN